MTKRNRELRGMEREEESNTNGGREDMSGVEYRVNVL